MLSSAFSEAKSIFGDVDEEGSFIISVSTGVGDHGDGSACGWKPEDLKVSIM